MAIYTTQAITEFIQEQPSLIQALKVTSMKQTGFDDMQGSHLLVTLKVTLTTGKYKLLKYEVNSFYWDEVRDGSLQAETEFWESIWESAADSQPVTEPVTEPISTPEPVEHEQSEPDDLQFEVKDGGNHVQFWQRGIKLCDARWFEKDTIGDKADTNRDIFITKGLFQLDFNEDRHLIVIKETRQETLNPDTGEVELVWKHAHTLINLESVACWDDVQQLLDRP